jgi:hypothetical protein
LHSSAVHFSAPPYSVLSHIIELALIVARAIEVVLTVVVIIAVWWQNVTPFF